MWGTPFIENPKSKTGNVTKCYVTKSEVTYVKSKVTYVKSKECNTTVK